MGKNIFDQKPIRFTEIKKKINEFFLKKTKISISHDMYIMWQFNEGKKIQLFLMKFPGDAMISLQRIPIANLNT